MLSKFCSLHTEMELQLGLALPVHNPVKGYDQIKNGIEASKRVGDCLEARNCVKRKRELMEKSLTMPLLSWSDQPQDDDNGEVPERNDFCIIRKKDEEKNHVVGWPPIELWRKKAFHRHHCPPTIENQRRAAQSHENGGRMNSFFVKVKMEGVAITRKLDLRLYHSHQSLKTALTTMFAAYQTCEKDDSNLRLIYEDKEGDWLLAEDLPWSSFVKSVLRLKILVRERNGD